MSTPHQPSQSREPAPPGVGLLTTGKGFNLRNSQGGEGECGAAGRAIWNPFEELGQSPATPPCAEAPGQPLALPAQLWPERGKSVGEQTGGARGQGERHVLTGPLSFSRVPWLASRRPEGGLARQLGDLLQSGTSAKWHFRSRGMAGAGLSGNASPAQPGIPRPGSGNPWTAPFLLHSGCPACAHSQSALSLSTRPRPSPTPGRRLHHASWPGGAAAATALG